MKLVADLRQKTDSFEKSGVFEASITWLALTAFILPTTDPYAEHACAPSSSLRLYALIDGTLPTRFSPLIFETPVELITRGVGYTCAANVQHCYRSFAQVPRDREVTSNSDYRSGCLVELYAT